MVWGLPTSDTELPALGSREVLMMKAGRRRGWRETQDKEDRRKTEERRLGKKEEKEKDEGEVGARCGGRRRALTSCCAGAGTPGRGPWRSALAAGSGTGRGPGWLERPTWRLAESCGTRARSTARARCCGRGAGPQGPSSPARAWAPRCPRHRSPATPCEEKLGYYSERLWSTSSHACCLGETCCLVTLGSFPWPDLNHDDLL